MAAILAERLQPASSGSSSTQSSRVRLLVFGEEKGPVAWKRGRDIGALV